MNPEKGQHECSIEGDQVAANTNIVHYERRAGQPMQLSGASVASEVVFIDENTPAPPLPQPWPHIPFHRRQRDGERGDEVIYIGPE